MTVLELSELIGQALYLALLVSAPALAVALIIGLGVGIASTVTQVQDASLSFVPKLIGVSLILFVFGSWMATELIEFTEQLWATIPTFVH